MLGLLFYAAAQGSVNMWLVRFLEKGEGTAPGAAHLVLIALAATLTIGRWICSYLSKKINPFTILTFMTIAAATVAFLAPLP